MAAEDESDFGPGCPTCGGDQDWEECHDCGGEGYVTEDDGVNGPEDYSCGLCESRGGWDYCPSCRAKRLKEWQAEQAAKEASRG